jgi:hypothetical protein
MDDWAQMAWRAAEDLPEAATLAIVPAPAILEIDETLHGSDRILRSIERWRLPPAGDLAALRTIRILV